MEKERKIEIGEFLFKNRGILPLPFIIILLAFGSYPISIKYSCLKYFGVIIAIIGELIRFFVAGFAKEKTSGRGMRIEANSLVNFGLYSLVRNPLYLGNFLIFLGFLMFSGNLIFILLGTIIFWVYYYYIVLAEENFLLKKFGKAYEEYKNKVPRFFPKSLKLSWPEYNYSLKKAIFREKDTIFIWIVSFIFLNQRLCGFCTPTKEIIIFFLVSFFLWLIVNVLKRKEVERQ